MKENTLGRCLTNFLRQYQRIELLTVVPHETCDVYVTNVAST